MAAKKAELRKEMQMLARLGLTEEQAKEYKRKKNADDSPTSPSTKRDNRPRGTLTENDKVMAQMTNINYRGRHAKVGQELPGTDFVLKRTSERYHTWYDEVNNKVVLSIKGTSFTKDKVQTWGGIALKGRNSNDNPARGAQAELDRIQEQYPDAVIEVTGHP